jgi:uncharacterized repeat protein (TIGR01451 family)
MSGAAGSLSGIDIDVVDIGSAIPSGSTQFTVQANTTADEYFVGSIMTAVAAVRPVLSGTTKTVTNLTRQDGRYLPGDTLQYTFTAQNTGNDVATSVMLTDVLPPDVTYVPGSIQVLTGANQGTKTDKAGDDQAEYTAASNTITVRLGTGANATTGGTLAEGASTSFSFNVTVNMGAQGTISNQGTISAVGQAGQGQGMTTPTTWPTGNGQQPGAPTVITISVCSTNADCTPQAPICDTAAMPPHCVCNTNSDCQNNMLCNPATQECVACLPGMTSNCDPNTVGGICLPTFVCGCQTNADCAGRACDTSTGTCAAVDTDLSLSLSRAPAGTEVAPGTPLTYELTLTDNGTAVSGGTELTTGFSPSSTSGTWTCTAYNGAQCPAASGTTGSVLLPSIPSNGSLVFVYSATAPSSPASSSLDFTATITPPAGFTNTDPGGNTVTDSVLIGMLPSGPDLGVTVDEAVSPTDPSVTYTVNVSNNGPGDAAGATVTYLVPGGTTVTPVGGTGWSCTQQGSEVVCTRTAPLPQGQTSSLELVTQANQGQPQIPLVVTVEPTDASGNPLTDPNPSNNEVNRTTTLGQFVLSGGGFACAMMPQTGRPGDGSGAAATAMLLLAALFVTRLRRRIEA